MTNQDHDSVEQDTLTDQQKEQWRELMDKPPENLSDSEITSKIRLSVRRRFSSPEWQMVYEFGGPNGRRADAIAVNTLPSRNYKIVGFEFKASRSDWLSEKDEGEKADHFVQICDEWYVVAGRKGIVKESELPDGWGLFELKPNSEQIWKMEDSELTEYQQGEPDRRFWAKFLKKTIGGESNYSKEDLREAKKRGYEEAVDEGMERNPGYEADQLKKKAEKWETLRDAGFDFIYYFGEGDLERLKLAYKLVEGLQDDGSYHSISNKLETFHDRIERDFNEMDDRMQELRDGLETLDEMLEDHPIEVSTDDD